MVDVTRLPGPVSEFWEWQLHGACRGRDSNLFFHPEGERGAVRDAREAAAKRICAQCPVIEACRRHALASREPYGVWGGMSEGERERLFALSDAAGAPVVDTPPRAGTAAALS